MRSLVNDKQAVVAQWQRYQKYSVVVEEVGCPAWASVWAWEISGLPPSLTPEGTVVGPPAARRIPG